MRARATALMMLRRQLLYYMLSLPPGWTPPHADCPPRVCIQRALARAAVTQMANTSASLEIIVPGASPSQMNPKEFRAGLLEII